ncbi:MAG: ABC transporter permease [Oscillospiraceae bacterium]|nr:ABC transporter permease [Oscillospiraceae bacterium]
MISFLELLNIIWVTLFVCFISTAISSFLAAPLALCLGLKNGVVIKVLRTVVTALSNVPPIVAGLLVYMLTSRSGPLAPAGWVYSKTAMVMAQILVVTPLIASVIFPMFLEMQKDFMETCKGLSLKKSKIYYLLFRECRYVYASAILIGFGRAMSEVAAVSLAGGNIRHKTRVLTTAIMLSTGKGDFAEALSLAGILIALVLLVNFLAGKLKGKNTDVL